MYLPKVLIATPTYEGKNYCLEQFIDNVKKFSYPQSRVDFMIFDNSAEPKNAKMINTKYGVKVHWRDYAGMTLIQKLAETHEAIRQHAINNHYDFILHLESDVFPPVDVIERLLWTKKSIIGVPYNLFGGGQRRLVTQGFKEGDVAQDWFITALPLGFNHHWFFDGTIKRVSTNGIGCTLMRVKTIGNTPFRFVEGDVAAPDTWFTRDLMAKKIPYYVHTGMLCFHWSNEDWGAYADLLTKDKKE